MNREEVPFWAAPIADGEAAIDVIVKAAFARIEGTAKLFSYGGVAEEKEHGENHTASSEENKVLIKGWPAYLYRNDEPYKEEQIMIDKIKRHLSELKSKQKITASWEKPKRSFSGRTNIEGGRIFFNQDEDYVLGKDKLGSWWALTNSK